MIEIYKKELENRLKNAEINTKIVHFHNINKEELNLMYKNFYEINNFNYPLSSTNYEVDNTSFSLYEKWIERKWW